MGLPPWVKKRLSIAFLQFLLQTIWGWIADNLFLWFLAGCALQLVASGNHSVFVVPWIQPFFFLRITRNNNISKPFLWFLLIIVFQAPCFLVPYWGFLKIFSWWQSILFLIGLSIEYFSIYAFDRFVFVLSRYAGLDIHWYFVFVFPMAAAFVSSVYVLVTPLIFLGSLGNVATVVYTQFRFMPMIQMTSVTGATGLYFIMSLFSSFLNYCYEVNFSSAKIRTPSIVIVLIFFCVLLGGSIRLQNFPPSSQVVQISSIQPKHPDMIDDFKAHAQNGRMPPESSFAQRNLTLEELFELSLMETKISSKIVFWVEHAIALFDFEVEAFLERASKFALEHDVYLGTTYTEVMTETCKKERKCLKSMFVLLTNKGLQAWAYQKVHLWPVLESKDYIAGTNSLPYHDSPYGRLGGSICYDLDFVTYMTRAGRANVDIMLVPSIDWSAVSPDHVNWGVFRCIENGFTMVRHSGNSWSKAFDYQGRDLASLNANAQLPNSTHILRSYAPQSHSWTIYPRMGEYVGILCGFGLFLITAYLIVRVSFKYYLRLSVSWGDRREVIVASAVDGDGDGDGDGIDYPNEVDDGAINVDVESGVGSNQEQAQDDVETDVEKIFDDNVREDEHKPLLE